MTYADVGAIVGCSGSTLVGTAIDRNVRNFIGGCINSNIISNSTYITDNCAIVGGAMTINPTVGRCRNSGGLAVDVCNITAGDTSAHVASQSSTISNPGKQNLMMSCSDCTISGSNDHNIVLGKSVTASGGYSFSCNLASGNSLTTTTNGRWTVKAPGAVYFYTNAGGTTGMFMAAGASSWTAVSDVNVKENFVPLDGPGVLAKVDQLPVWSYNYIGNPESQRCYGPTAQDWHSLFPSSKDPLGIEQGDVLGVCLAAIKELSAKINRLSA